ncbi:MAG: exopolysaccharide biosynthesis polyprenyl glycosylphosphotransferase [Phycisphaerales bacterium]|nr:exopolysaccharide biosynthesis polyprenyl glycosylphosphotransferase [Phycisphaerales bacterium]
MLRERHQIFLSLFVASDAVIATAATWGAWWVRFRLLEGFKPYGQLVDSTMIPFWSAAPVILIVAALLRLYKPRRDEHFVREFKAILRTVVVASISLVTLLTLFRNELTGGVVLNNLQFVIFGLVLLVGMTANHYILRRILRWARTRGLNIRPVAIIGTGPTGQQICRTLRSNSWTGIHPSFFISHDAENPPEACEGLPVRGTLESLETVLHSESPSGVFIALPNAMASQIEELMATLGNYPVDVRVVPDLSFRFIMNMKTSDLDGVPILSVRESPLNGWGGIVKRGFDIVGSAMALVILAIPMLLAAILVRCSGPGPIFFRQQRHTANGREFSILKFRTMRVLTAQQAQAEEESGQWQRGDTARVTGIGRFLRRTSLDELPQLFNVLRGEMSLVGPRPLAAGEVADARDNWNGFMLRQNVRSGITGWAQVHGLRGEASNRIRMIYDLHYIRNWSVWLDFWIIMLTVKRIFRDPSAE